VHFMTADKFRLPRRPTLACSSLPPATPTEFPERLFRAHPAWVCVLPATKPTNMARRSASYHHTKGGEGGGKGIERALFFNLDRSPISQTAISPEWLHSRSGLRWTLRRGARTLASAPMCAVAVFWSTRRRSFRAFQQKVQAKTPSDDVRQSAFARPGPSGRCRPPAHGRSPRDGQRPPLGATCPVPTPAVSSGQQPALEPEKKRLARCCNGPRPPTRPTA
jgi:hypothetical protein